MYYAFGNHIYTFPSVPLRYFLFGRHISFSVFMPNNFNIIHTCVSIHNTYVYQMLSNIHNYFYLAGIFVLSYLWLLMYFCFKDILPGITFCIHVSMICICAHTYIHAVLPISIHPGIHTCIHASMPKSLHPHIPTHSCMYVYIMHIYMYNFIPACLHTYMHTYTYVNGHINT